MQSDAGTGTMTLVFGRITRVADAMVMKFEDCDMLFHLGFVELTHELHQQQPVLLV